MNLRKKDLKIYIDFCLIFFYLAVMITGVLRAYKVIPCYWHSGTVFYLTGLLGIHLFLNWRQFLVPLQKMFKGE